MIKVHGRRHATLLLMGASLVSLCAGTAAFAQDAAPSSLQSDTAAADDIIVTGTRASLSKALDIKRETIGVVDSIAAEDIGKFPDQNVAESLQRITGVSIDRSGGEGRFITVRGFGPEFNTVLLNGRLLATENSGREFSFDILPSEVLSAAEVYKSATAEQQDGGIGSTVMLRTARPLDNPGFHFSGSAAAKFDSTRDKAAPVISGIVSNTNADETFGVLASFNYDKRISRFSNVNTSGWITGQNLDFDKNGTVDLANVALPRTYNTTVERNTRERITATIGFDWIVSDKLKLQLDGLYTQLKVDSWSNQLGFYTDPGDIIDATANENGTVTHFVRSAGGGLASDNIVFDSPRDAKTYQIGLNARYTPGDRTTIDFDISHSRAKEGYTSVFYVVGEKNAGVNPTFDLNPGSLPTITNILPTDDPSRAVLHCCSERGSKVSDDITSLRIDGKQEFDTVLKSIRFGAVGTRRKKDITSLLTPDPLGCFYCGYFASADPGLFTTFNDGGVLGGAPMSWLTYDPVKLAQYYGNPAAVSQKGDQTAEDAFNAVYAANGYSMRPTYDPRGSGSVREYTAAAYLQAELGGDLGDHPWNAVVGARYVYTNTLARGNSVQLLNITQNPGDPTAGVATFSPPVPVSEKHNYSYVLPSATFRVNWTDKLVTRAAFSRTLTRPTLSNLTLSKSYDFRPPQSNTISSGNPGLKPYLAWNADIAADYFIGKTSYVSVAGFYKWVDNFISQVTTTETYFGFDFNVTRPENTRKSKVYGFEVAAQYTFDKLPAPFDGFGVLANYTKVKSSTSFDPSIASGIFSVEGLSDSANAVLFYEKGPVQLRGAYNWRDKFLARARGLNGEPENVDSYGQYDLSGSFKFTENFAVFGEVVNLTNKHRRTFSRYDERLIQLDDTGRRVSVGVRATF
ncbi:TonB-dependent receptor [Sphingomonas fennica]|uniref:TonB-dependent receptor n=1 Tax=Edaphosphingomonas fennica TaxID=114404 RepID=A0A2T4HT93_9SPHN|nr:TonB-dependent receptor [Sphingomonas fennica]PTD18970.1 TonB-dependent receptor [Sphingomonas fennica]